jgi:hypothetical protein
MSRRIGPTDLRGNIPLSKKSLIMGSHETSVRTESWPIVAKLGILFSILDVDVSLLLSDLVERAALRIPMLNLMLGSRVKEVKEPILLGSPPCKESRHASSSSMVDKPDGGLLLLMLMLLCVGGEGVGDRR